MTQKLSILLFFCIFFTTTLAASSQDWKKRSIYQIVTDRFALTNNTKPDCDLDPKVQPKYCGGSFRGIINNLDYITGMGFNAIWISPVPLNFPNQFHGYAAKDLSKINPFFGGEEELLALVEECHKRDVYVMVDVVANHMGAGSNIYDFDTNVPFNDQIHFHDYCQVTDECMSKHDMQCLQNCRLYDLPDLKQENSFVKYYLLNWIFNLVHTYQIDGLRIDTVQYAPQDFWKEFVSTAGVFALGEVFDSDMNFVSSYVPSVGSILNYPFYLNMKDVFVSGKKMGSLHDYYKNWEAADTDISIFGLFADNHDNPRFLSTQMFSKTSFTDQEKLTKYKNLLTLTLTSTGIPIIYYGTEQGFSGNSDPYDREPLWNSMNTESELYQFISIIHAGRRSTQGFNQPQVESLYDDLVYSYYRGQMLVVILSQISNVKRTIKPTPYTPGLQVCNILSILTDDNECIIVGGDGSLKIQITGGLPKVYIPYVNSIDLMKLYTKKNSKSQQDL